MNKATDTLTEEQRRVYALEKLNNFRWIFKILAARSSYVLTDADLASPETNAELTELGQFAEIAYSKVPFEFIFSNIAALLQPDFPLEGYEAVQGCILLSSFKGQLGQLPAYAAYRPSTKQLVVAICGTTSMQLAYHDLRALKHRHPSGNGSVHTGFWDVYKGIKPLILDTIQKGLKEHDVDDLVITGHSMGGSIAYLLCIDLLSGDDTRAMSLPPGLRLTIAVFGAPRTGDTGLVKHWRELVAAYQKANGKDKLREYSVKAYNDGVPALPPTTFGYKHFAEETFYFDKARLYHVPASESEYGLFTISPSETSETPAVLFPRGGHNYYNGRDMERLGRRIIWLGELDPEQSGWEDRYRKAMDKHRA